MSAKVTAELPLAGRTAWITGGSSGIGAATADALEAQGATVGVLDLTAPSASRAWTACDLADRASFPQAVVDLRSQVGAADILVCSAGITGAHTVEGHPDDLWDRVLAVNLTGTFLAIRACLPHMLEHKWGRIVTLSSGGGVRVLPERAAYATSKAGVIAITKATAVEVASTGVTANAIAPGLVNTPMAGGLYGGQSGAESAVKRSHVANPMKVLLDPSDISAGVEYLCSPGGRYVTGQVLHINAGSVM